MREREARSKEPEARVGRVEETGTLSSCLE